MNPYVAPVLYVRRPGSDNEETHHFAEDDPFFSEVSVWIDNIEDIEEDPDTAQILSTFEGASCWLANVFPRGVDDVLFRCREDLRAYLGDPRGGRALPCRARQVLVNPQKHDFVIKEV